jgi:hypothetical protein
MNGSTKRKRKMLLDEKIKVKLGTLPMDLTTMKKMIGRMIK